ncbi:MAG: lamin tail domain-containing protein [Microcoleaceae cyanobacterium]
MTDNTDNIYQTIWESDENKFSVSTRNASGEWEDENADILLDEQKRASGKRNIDLATHPLFHKVNEEKLFEPNRTYNAFINLLDNYAIHFLEEEFTAEEEEKEQLEFISLIMTTQPIQLAREYINQRYGENLSDEQFHLKLQRVWFELYTNYYKGKSTHFCSGFEHVFVGEAKYNARYDDKRETLGEISGYHSWVKFYLDEKNDRVNFLGYKYDLKGNEGMSNPNVVTLQMTQAVTDMRGNIIAQLFKKKGGFFVGPSPECEIAIATLVYYDSVYGNSRDKKRVNLDGGYYDLVVYRNINPNGSRGEFIRSFFPIFLGQSEQSEVKEPQMDRPVIVPVERIVKTDGSVIITAALPNPRGQDDGEEWVELTSRSQETIDLTGWELRDKMGRPESLRGTLPPGETLRIRISRADAYSMQMTNRSGLISLYDKASELVAAVEYSRATSGAVIQFADSSNPQDNPA